MHTRRAARCCIHDVLSVNGRFPSVSNGDCDVPVFPGFPKSSIFVALQINDEQMNILPIDTQSPYYGPMEKLMEQAFPADERRLPANQRRVVDTDPRMVANALVHEGAFAGLLTYWKLDGFVYVEHLATLPELRGKGLGAEAMKQLAAEAGMPVVLEVELPEDELTRRRVNFYRRCGLVLWERQAYLQPPYHDKASVLPLRLMVYGSLDEMTDFDRVRAAIHTSAYARKEPLTSV